MTSFTDNLFRRDVNDPNDVIFDLNRSLDLGSNSLREPLPVTPIGGGGQVGFSFNIPKINIDLPKIQGPDINIQGPELNVPELEVPDIMPKINIDLPDIPKIDLSTPQPDFQPAIDAITKPFGDAIGAIGGAVGAVTKPVGDALGSTIDSISKAIGQPIDQFKDVAVRQGDGSNYGEMAIGKTGTVVDISKHMDNLIADVTKGTAIEGVGGRDIYNITKNPSQFVAEKGKEAAVDLFSSKLGMEKNFASDVVSALENPDKFVKTKGVQAATDFILESSGVVAKKGAETAAKGAAGAAGAVSSGAVHTDLAGKVFDKTAGAAISGGAISGLSTLLSTGDAGKAPEAAAKGAATSAVVNTVSNIANVIIPGSGVVISILAAVFKYSCYLSTSAYHHGYIDKKTYFDFTRYRLKVQSKEILSEQVWLGYIMLFEPLYDGLLHNKRASNLAYHLVTLPWLKHIRFKLGTGPFNLRGFIMTKILWTVCLGSYIVNYKKAQERKKALSGINLMEVYQYIVRIIEKEHAFA